MSIEHWSDAWIYCDAENKTFYHAPESELLIVEWVFADDKMITMVFDTAENTLLLWRII